MQSISRFLAVLIALVFLIGSLTSVASAHATPDGDHTGADYGTVTLTRQDSLGDMVHVGQRLQFAFTFTASDDHTAPGATAITLVGATAAGGPFDPGTSTAATLTLVVRNVVLTMSYRRKIWDLQPAERSKCTFRWLRILLQRKTATLAKLVTSLTQKARP